MRSIAGKHVLITGGSQGLGTLGSALVQSLGFVGFRVWGLGLRV